MHGDLSHFVEAELMGRPGTRPRGDELDFVCPVCPDTNGSAGWNRRAGVWKCLQCGNKGHTTDLAQRLGLRVDPNPPAATAAPARRANFNVVAAYDYRDRNGHLLFQVCRLDPKDFRQRRPDPEKPSGWTWKKGEQQVLYRLPELLASTGRVYLVEGEKDVDTLAGLGLTATTAPEGATSPRLESTTGVDTKQAPKWLPDYWKWCEEHRVVEHPVQPKWRPEFTETLRGRDVVIIRDYDAAGFNHATGVACYLHGEAKSVRILDLPNPDKPGFDVSDWIARQQG